MEKTCELCGETYGISPAGNVTFFKKRQRFCSRTCASAATAGPPRRSIKERFWERVIRANEADCWTWTGAIKGFGYGHMLVAGRMQSAHRISYEMHVGPIPPRMFVCHRCDNPRCVNPAHLFLGNNQDNVRDMLTKGRHYAPGAKGERNGHAKLDEASVRAIRSSTERNAALAARHNVSIITVQRIKRGSAWAHIA